VRKEIPQIIIYNKYWTRGRIRRHVSYIWGSTWKLWRRCV